MTSDPPGDDLEVSVHRGETARHSTGYTAQGRWPVSCRNDVTCRSRLIAYADNLDAATFQWQQTTEPTRRPHGAEPGVRTKAGVRAITGRPISDIRPDGQRPGPQT